jgi:hypothetical protein
MRAPALAAILLAILFVQGILFITASSQTSDEAAHLAAGYSYLKSGDFRLNPEHPPLIKELAAAPLLALPLQFPWGPLWDQSEEWNIGRLFVHENTVANDTILLLGRLPVLLLSLCLGWAMFHWGRRLFGEWGALLGLALYVFDPNVVAHSSLITTDLGITLFIFLSVYAFWCWSLRPSRRTLLLFGLAAGGAFAAKYTAVWLPPILAGLGLALVALRAPLPERPLAATAARPVFRSRWRSLRALFVAAGAVLVVAFAVVALTYGIVGLPAYLVGLERTLHHSAIGHRAYLMGSVSETGWWYYFLLAWLIKTPPGTILLVGASLLFLAIGTRRSLRDELFLYLPVALTVLITCFWKVNIGLRHLMPIYPFLYLGVGRLLGVTPDPSAAAPATGGGRRPSTTGGRRAAVALCALALGWNVVEAARIAPDQLAYFNQFAGGPANGHHWLLDSNLDWGQASKSLRRYVEEQRLPMIYCAYNGNSDPWYVGLRYQYVPGSGNLRNAKERPARMPASGGRELFAINVMVLHSLHFSDPHLYDWMLAKTPVATPGYSYFVYDITGDAESHSYMAVLCLNFGLVDLAEFEAHRTLSLAPGNALAQAVLREIVARGRQETGADPPGPDAPQHP